ncbi:hypothetical protein FQA39_LY12816 [Lamprigera yunnana]|nr:hypothetical protein FQA39_LY12816 [Lamprigera yunnana]
MQNIIGSDVYTSNDQVIEKLELAKIEGIATISAELATRTETSTDFKVTVTADTGYKLEGTGIVTVTATVDTDKPISDETIKTELQNILVVTLYSNDQVIEKLELAKIEGIATISGRVSYQEQKHLLILNDVYTSNDQVIEKLELAKIEELRQLVQNTGYKLEGTGIVTVTATVDTDKPISDETIKTELQNIIGSDVYTSNDQVIEKLELAKIEGIATISAELATRTETPTDFKVTVTADTGYKLEGTGIVTVTATVDTDKPISDETIKTELQNIIGSDVYTSNDQVIEKLELAKIEGIATISAELATRTETPTDFKVTVTADTGYKLEGTGIVTRILEEQVGNGQVFGSPQNAIDVA